MVGAGWDGVGLENGMKWDGLGCDRIGWGVMGWRVSQHSFAHVWS